MDDIAVAWLGVWPGLLILVLFVLCMIKRHRNKKQKDRDTKRYRLKRAIQRAVMRNIIASDSAFSSDVHIASVKKKHPAEASLRKPKTLADVVDYDMYSRGTVIGVEDNIPVLWMHFYPFESMTEQDRKDLQFVCDFMYSHKSMHSPIYSNGACIRKNRETRKIIGTMYAAGWRGAQVPYEDFGVYKPNKCVKVNADKWKESSSLESKVAEIYKRWFAKLSVSSYEHCKHQTRQTRVPLFGVPVYPPEHASELFGSNLTYTFDGFSNVQHLDKDDNDYTFGMWFPVRKEGFKLARHADGFAGTGGQFVWSEYGIGADFLKCDGVTMLVWRGKHDVHGTVQSTPAEGFTVLGSSIQVADYLVRKVAGHVRRKEEGDNLHVVADTQYQYNKIK